MDIKIKERVQLPPTDVRPDRRNEIERKNELLKQKIKPLVCDCGIIIKNICRCKTPIFEVININQS